MQIGTKNNQLDSGCLETSKIKGKKLENDTNNVIYNFYLNNFNK